MYSRSAASLIVLPSGTVVAVWGMTGMVGVYVHVVTRIRDFIDSHLDGPPCRAIEIFCDIPQSIQADAEIYLQIGHDRPSSNVNLLTSHGLVSSKLGHATTFVNCV
jgi:hypothetical protein